MSVRHISGISGKTETAELAHSPKSAYFNPSSWVPCNYLFFVFIFFVYYEKNLIFAF